MAQIDGRAFEELRDAFWGADPGMEGGAARDPSVRSGTRPVTQPAKLSRQSGKRKADGHPARRLLEELGRRLRIEEVPRPVLVAVVFLAAVALLLGALLLGRPRAGEIVVRESHVEAVESPVAVSDTTDVATGEAALSGEATPETDPSEQIPTLVVHVAGCVAAPGVYELEEGSRVVDAVEAAGGLTAEADVTSVNLAEPLGDGCKVTIPSLSLATEGEVSADAASVVSYASATGSMADGAAGLVNLNYANAAELCTLPGVGESTAAEIVRDREANGPFASIEDLMRVSGIGEKKFDRLKDMVCV